MSSSDSNHQFLFPTPGGAYFTVTNQQDSPAKVAISKLMSVETTPTVSNEVLDWLFADLSAEEHAGCLKALQTKKLLQAIPEPKSLRKGKLEIILPEIIQGLSYSGSVLIADSQGFCLSSVGFGSELIDEISVLSADIADLHQRRVLSIYTKLNLHSSAWAIVDAAGNSKLGFWPLKINNEIFVLAIEGVPYLNQTIFTELIWLLNFRYGTTYNDGENK